MTAGKLACLCCMEDTKSFTLKHGRKDLWFDCHRRFLPPNHEFRRMKYAFRKNKTERDVPPPVLTGHDIWERVQNFPKVTEEPPYKFDGYGVAHNWTKQSIFWELPYWKDNLLRHNLDVMHIEKNYFDNLFNTVMDVTGKTKDNVKARLDLPELCRRPELHLQEYTNNKLLQPKASYSFTMEQKQKICEWVQSLKMPDGYASNLGKTVDMEHGILHGMKSHDCHVFMEQLLPIAFCGLPENVWKPMAEISLFFKDLCSSTLRVENLVQMAENIVIISNKLEKILPPGFFDVMEHLPIHLVNEALLGGPVQNRWMYPFERTIGKCKRGIKNNHWVEGCIVQVYLTRERTHFCSYYFDDHVSCLRNRSNRHDDAENDPAVQPLSIFNQPGKGSKKRTMRKLTEMEKISASLHVLLNCPEVQPILEWQIKTTANKKKPANAKKKIKLNTNRRPTGIVIDDEPPRVNVPPQASLSATHSANQSQNASTRVAPHSNYSISVPIMAPTTGYQTPQGYSNLGLESTIPSASASGSVGLSALRIGSNGSEPNTPTTHHSDAHGPQPGDRDCYRRLVIKPVGYGISPDEGWAGTIRKCVGTDYNGVYPSLGSIPLRTQGQMFNEFKKYYVWSPEHEEQIQVNFKNKATKVLANIFCTSRKINQRPTFVEPQLWAKLQEFWNTDEKFKKRSEIGKEARASEKGGSLHTGGAISQLTRKKRMEEELGREVPQAELFKVTHIKKMINPTDEESWIEPRAKETHDRYVQKVQDYLSTLPPESLDAPHSQEVTERLWRKSAGEPVRGIVYGYPEKVYHEKKSWFYCSSSSDIDGVDKATVSKMEDKISLFTAELAAVAEREKERDEREKKREEQVAASKEVENKRFAMLQAQLKSLFDCGIIIPPSPSDTR